MSSRRLAFINFKGGVGKTSLTVNLAACLAKFHQQRVLVVDLDCQSNCSLWMMGREAWPKLNAETPQFSTWGIFGAKPPPISKSVVMTFPDEFGIPQFPGLSLLPSVYELMNLEDDYEVNPKEPPYYRFFLQLSPLFEYYDYILFDCPPNLFRAAQCAMFSAQEIYVPANPDILSYAGLSLLASKVSKFHGDSEKFRALAHQKFPALHSGQTSKIAGIILNDLAGQANHDAVLADITAKIIQLRTEREVLPSADILPPRIRKAEGVGQAANHALPALLRPGFSGLKDDYLDLSSYIHGNPPKI